MILQKNNSTYSVTSLYLHCECHGLLDKYDDMIALANGEVVEVDGWTVLEPSEKRYFNMSKIWGGKCQK